jgi:aminopeptidase-like protein
MRLEFKQGINQCSIINDSYNIDLDSIQIALDFLSQQVTHANKTIILSDVYQSAFSDEILYQKIAAMTKRKYTYRFVFAPETIGIIYYLSKHGEHLKTNLKAGYVLTCCGDAGDFTYKRSRRITSEADVVAEHVLAYSGNKYTILPFAIGGSDERQYCSPGFNLPVGSFIRTKYQEYKEYHTSLDNKDFISFDAMYETINMIFDVVKALEINEKYMGSIQHCEAQLGRRGLYSNLGGLKNRSNELSNRLHFLNYADGEHTLREVAELSNQSMLNFEKEIQLLKDHGLIV